jgi:hypothetical protein
MCACEDGYVYYSILREAAKAADRSNIRGIAATSLTRLCTCPEDAEAHYRHYDDSKSDRYYQENVKHFPHYISGTNINLIQSVLPSKSGSQATKFLAILDGTKIEPREKP